MLHLYKLLIFISTLAEKLASELNGIFETNIQTALESQKIDLQAASEVRERAVIADMEQKLSGAVATESAKKTAEM